MSVTDSLVTQAHFDYIRARCNPEDEFLAQLRVDAVEARIPAISIGPAQAAFMQILLKLARAEQVIEVGTLAGYSAIAMARALPPSGCVRTLELSPQHAAFARDRVERSDVKGKVEVLEGPAIDHLKKMGAASADAAFLDADKSGYASYLVECKRTLRPNGLIMVDNAFAFGELFAEEPADPETPAVRAFNEVMAKDPDVEAIILPMGDGLWVGRLR